MSDTYAPTNTLKPVADNVWIVDGATIRFGMPWPKMPFPTRMTIVRLDGGALFIHSPTALTMSCATNRGDRPAALDHRPESAALLVDP
jgi:hypothetical protein